MKNIFSYILLIFILQGCISDDNQKDDGLPYYQFTKNELDKLIEKTNVGDEKIYINQYNEITRWV